MDFRLTQSEQRFRSEVRRWLRITLPKTWYGSVGITEDDETVSRMFVRGLAAKGWGALVWPERFGGAGATYFEQFVFNEQMAYARAPVGAHNVGVGFVGPTLMAFGTPEQQAQHLPQIARGEVIWCQGFSEPGSGSDLASLQTRALECGDEFVINGSKIWTSYAHMADWMILLARTDQEVPKHKGLSFFFVDMRSPGIRTSPLLNLAGFHGLNEVFFDDVHVPRENLVGSLNQGWYIAATTLDFERSSIAGSASARRTLDDVRHVLAEGTIAAPRRHMLRLELAERWVEADVALMLSYQVVTMQTAGKVPNHEASAAKLYTAELGQRVYATGVKCLGLSGQLARFSHRRVLGGRVAEGYLDSVSATIAGGTSEIQRTVMATRGLGLPRG